jgi:small neutral amino acid transporter SnatA (MarC family)
VAALIIAVFVLFGQQILLYLGIRLPSMEAPGGLLLLWSHSTCFAARPRPVRRELNASWEWLRVLVDEGHGQVS